MKDEGPKVFKLVKTNSVLDFLKNNTPSASTSDGIIFDKIQIIPVHSQVPTILKFSMRSSNSVERRK